MTRRSIPVPGQTAEGVRQVSHAHSIIIQEEDARHHSCGSQPAHIGPEVLQVLRKQNWPGRVTSEYDVCPPHWAARLAVADELSQDTQTGTWFQIRNDTCTPPSLPNPMHEQPIARLWNFEFEPICLEMFIRRAS